MYVRRKYPRFSVSGVAEVTVPGGKRHLSGMIEKISQGGIGVYTDEKIERGAKVELEVVMFTGPDTSVYHLTGVVQNFEKQKESGLLGIRFNKIINEKDHADLFFYLTLLSKQFSKYRSVL